MRGFEDEYNHIRSEGTNNFIYFNSCDSIVILPQFGFAIKVMSYLADFHHLYSEITIIINDLMEHLWNRQSTSFSAMKYYS